MTINAIALDDEPLPLEIVTSYCERFGDINLVSCFTNTGEASSFLRSNEVDLIFIDIEMPQQSGIDFCLEHCRGKAVVFMTAYSEYAIAGFDLDVVDFLLKPFTYERFEEAIKKSIRRKNAFNLEQSPSVEVLMLTSNYGVIVIPESDIVYVESFADYLDIHLFDGKKHTVRMTMKELALRLKKDTIIRVHRSYFVDLKKIEFVRKKVIHIAGKQIPIGANYEMDFQSKFNIQ